MREAVVVALARTPIGKAYRGAFNDTTAQALAAHAISNAVARAGLAPEEVGDVVLGAHEDADHVVLRIHDGNSGDVPPSQQLDGCLEP